MTRASLRREPVISFGPGPERPASIRRQITRAPRYALTGDLTRTIRREQSKPALEHIRHALSLSPRTFEALSTELLYGDGPLLGDEAITRAMRALFDFEPVVATTSHPVILVGGARPARMRVALALSQRLEWAGRRVSLCSFNAGAVETPQWMSCGGLDLLEVGSVDACIDAVRAREPYEMAVIDASCLDGREDDADTLPKLALSLNAEPVYVDDGQSPLPDFDRMPGVERLILSGKPDRTHYGALLDMACARTIAFAGQCHDQGIFHPMTPAMLADRFAISVRQGVLRSD